MVTNNEITTNKSDIINSKEIDKELQREIMPVSRNIDLGFKTGIPPFNKILVTCDGTDKSDKATIILSICPIFQKLKLSFYK